MTDNIPAVPYIFPMSDRLVDLARLTVDDVTVERLALGLGNLCRYSGQIPWLYTVAEHSIHVASQVPQEHRLAALLHDASEALGLGDVIAPVKRLMPLYVELEARVMAVVEERFWLEPGACSHPLIKAADRAVYLAEQRDLRGVDLAVLPASERTVEPARVDFFNGSPCLSASRWRRTIEGALNEVVR